MNTFSIAILIVAAAAATSLAATTSKRPSNNEGSNRAASVRNAPITTTTTKRTTTKRCGNPPFVSCGECSTEPWPASPNGTSTVFGGAAARSARVVQMNMTSAELKKRGEPRRLMYFDVGEKVYYRPVGGDSSNYTLIGTTSVTCQADGTWSPAPKCQRKSGCNIPIVTNADCSGANGARYIALGRTASCVCKSGFLMSGSGVITCAKGNVFSELLYTGNATTSTFIFPMCRGTTTTSTTPAPVCPMKPVIQYGSCSDPVSGTTFPIGATSTCTCRAGCTLTSTVKPVCTAASPRPKFTNVPKCTCVTPGARNCSVPAEIPNAGCSDCSLYTSKQRVTSFTPGDSIVFDCKPGFRMEGNPTIRCQVNGSWTASPRCVAGPATPARIKCRNMPVMTNGRCYLTNVDVDDDELDDNEFVVGREVKCECGNSQDEFNLYNMVGSEFVYCQNSGQWGQVPRCDKIARTTTPTTTTQSRLCPLPNIANQVCAADNGDQLFDIGETVNCECIDGWRAQNPAAAVMACQPGRVWTNAGGLNCIGRVKCYGTPTIANGFCNEGDDVAEDGDSVTCQCQSGYSLSNPALNRLTCLRTGQWSTNVTCVQGVATLPPASRICTASPSTGASCPLPVGRTYLNSGESITCSCPAGRTWVDSTKTSTMCRGGNQWTQPLPSCR